MFDDKTLLSKTNNHSVFTRTNDYYSYHIQDVFVLDYETAKKISNINNLKTPQLHELTARGIKLVAHFSKLTGKAKQIAKEHAIHEVFNLTNRGDCGLDFVSKN